MLPVVILAKYYSSTWSAVSERPNLNVRLVFECSVLLSRQAYSPAYFKHSIIATCYVFSDSEIFIRHLNHTIQQNAIKNNTNRKKHVGRLPLRHCYVASIGATKLDT